MATSSTYTFNLDIADIIEEAYERIGLEFRSGYDLRTARRSLNLLLTEWTNRGINLWNVDQYSTTLSANTATYTLSSELIDVLDAVIRDSSSTDLSLTRVSMSEYLALPDKTSTGRPVQYMIERNASSNTLYLWPVPDATYTFVHWGIRYMQDAGSVTNNLDIPRRFLPALVSGLAYYLADKYPTKVDINRRQELLNRYESEFTNAKFEDHERASLFIVPDFRINMA